MAEKLAYSPREAAKAAGHGVTQLYAALASGQLRGKKRGRRTLILNPDLKEYLASLPDYESHAVGEVDE